MDILNLLIEITVYSAVIFTVTMLLKTLLKSRMSALLQYAVWAVFILRLLLPVTVTSPVHFFVVPQQQTAAAQETETEPQYYQMPENLTADTVVNGETAVSDSSSATNNAAAANTPSEAAKRTELTWQQIAVIIWLAGAGICVVYLAAVYLSLKNRIKRKCASPSAKLKTLFEETKAEMGIKANLRLVCVSEYGTPALMFPHTVIMPFYALAAMDDGQTKYALRHELMHYKRKDHIVSLILSVLNVVYWFNPIVWLAFRQIRMDMETACDGAVVKGFDKRDRDSYASLIVRLFAQPEHKQIVLGFAQADAKKVAEKRVRGIFMKSKSKISVKLAAIVIAVVLLFTCFTTACQPVERDAADYEQEQITETTGQSVSPESTLTAEPEKILLSESLGVPERYAADITVDKLSITADAQIDFPETDRVPVYRVYAADFTQQQVDGFIKVLFDDETLYEWETGVPVTWTKARIEKYLPIWRERKKATEGEFATEEGQAWCDREIARLEALYPTAPEDNVAILSEGKLRTLDLLNHETGEKEAAYTGLIVFTEDDTAGMLVENNNDLEAPLHYANGASLPLERNAVLRYSFHGFDNYWQTPEISVDKDAVITDEKVLKKLKMTPVEAQELAEGLLETAGIDCMALYSMSLVDNANYGNVDGEVSDASLYAYKLKFIRTADELRFVYTEGTTTSLGVYWDYERLEMYIDDRGVIYLEWWSPLEVDENIITDAVMLPFDSIKQIFEETMQAKYKTDSSKISINIDRLTIELIRVADQDSIGSGLIVPVWSFYGTKTVDGQKLSEEPVPLLMINGIDGLAINTQNG